MHIKKNERMKFLVLFSFFTAALVEGQQGFISIDCGYIGDGYNDDQLNLFYVSDVDYIDTGNSTSVPNMLDEFTPTHGKTLRYFPAGVRNCYFIANGIVEGDKYLIRGYFSYSNYDSETDNAAGLFQFDLYLGVDKWQTINFTRTSKGHSIRAEIITVAKADYFSVCLVSTNQGTPFINAIEVRLVDQALYPDVNQSVSLVLSERYTMGSRTRPVLKGSLVYGTLRYPVDKYDRIWMTWNFNYYHYRFFNTTSSAVANPKSDPYQVPSLAMQSFVSPPVKNTALLYVFLFPQFDRKFGPLYVYMHFAELKDSTSRSFEVEGYPDVGTITPQYLIASHIQLVYQSTDYVILPLPMDAPNATTTNNTISINSLDSTNSPILNAYETYYAIYLTGVATNQGDVIAMMAIKQNYRMTTWQGDPCSSQTLPYQWPGVQCITSNSEPPRIIKLAMSNLNLNGNISDAFANITTLQYLDLSYNNLMGPIPAFFSALPSLLVLNLSHNQLSGNIPAELLDKNASGSLDLILDYNCELQGQKCEGKKLKTSTMVGIAVLALIGIFFIVAIMVYFTKKKIKKTIQLLPWFKPYEEDNGDINNVNPVHREFRRFTHEELKITTNNFESILGRGGFGNVYYGKLSNGVEVAVKFCGRAKGEDKSTGLMPDAPKSSQSAIKQFDSEVNMLSRIHHRNLVFLIGCCEDPDNLALVYEYLSQGSINDHLTGKKNSAEFSSWKIRLQIALGAAQGLEYLHNGCMKRIIHRDIKTANILLNHKLEAKIADFGLSRAYPEDKTHVSTNCQAGTIGYLDPESYNRFRPMDKSDVYSFGVVLLELVTALPVVIHKPTGDLQIIDVVRHKLDNEVDISEIVDPKFSGQYDEDSVKRFIELALSCASQNTAARPSMAEIIAPLKECLRLEMLRIGSSAAEVNEASSKRDSASSNRARISTRERSSNSLEISEIEGR